MTVSVLIYCTHERLDGKGISSASALAFEMDEGSLAAHGEIADGAETAARAHDTDRSHTNSTVQVTP